MKARVVRVGDVLALQRRAVEVDPLASYVEIGVRSFGRGIFHKEAGLGVQLGAKRVFRIEAGDLVISNVFAWEGAIAVAGADDGGHIGSHRFMTFVAIDGQIDTRWASWFFRSERGMNLIQHASPGSAGRNRTLAIERFEDLEIPLPPIDTQREIAGRLDALQRKAAGVIDRVEQASPESTLAMLPALIDGLLRSESEARARVRDLADFVNDPVARGEDPGPARVFVGPNHIEGHTGRCLGSDPLSESTGPKLRFRPGDIVYLRLRPYLNKVWAADRHGLCSSDQIVLRPRYGLDPQLIAYGLRSSSALMEAIRRTSSLQLPRIRQPLLAGIELPTDGVGPPDFVERLDRTRDLVVNLADTRRRQHTAAKALMPSFLNEAFGGSA